MDIVFEHEGRIWIEMETCIDILLKRVEAMGMELEVYGQDMKRSEYSTIQNLAKGLTFASLCLTNEYISITPDDERRAFYLAMAERMEKIVQGEE